MFKNKPTQLEKDYQKLEVNENSAAYDYQELCNLIIEVEEIYYIIKKIKSCMQ